MSVLRYLVKRNITIFNFCLSRTVIERIFLYTFFAFTHSCLFFQLDSGAFSAGNVALINVEKQIIPSGRLVRFSFALK